MFARGAWNRGFGIAIFFATNITFLNEFESVASGIPGVRNVFWYG
jgi:hypothetical protein